MTARRLQEWLDELRATSRQRWVLGLGAVLCIAAASAITGTRSIDGLVWIVPLASLTAAIAAVQPGSHWATNAITIVLIQWAIVVDDVTSVRAPVVAACLFAFHSALALMAVTPHGGTVDGAIVRLWLRRGALVLGATAAMWLVVVGLDHRNAGGNPTLTVAAVITVAVAAVALRVRTVD